MRRFFGAKGRLFLRAVHAGGGEGGHAFAAAEEAHGFIGGGFDADAGGGESEGGADAFFHEGEVGGDFGFLGDEGGVDVVEADGFFVQQGPDSAEDFEAADAANAGVGIWKKMAYVGFAGGAEEGVGDGMAEDIGVGVAVEPKRVGDHRAAEDERAVHDEAVDIIAYAGGDRSRPRSSLPLEATMEYFSGREAWGCISTRPPAVSTRRIPAATSQRLIMFSM